MFDRWYVTAIEIGTDAEHTGLGWMAPTRAGSAFEHLLYGQLVPLPFDRSPFETEAVRRDLHDYAVYDGETGYRPSTAGAVPVARRTGRCGGGPAGYRAYWWCLGHPRRGRGRRRLLRLFSHANHAVTTHLVSAALTGWLVEDSTGVDLAASILEEPPAVEDGHVHLPDRPGHGYRLDRDAVAEFAVRSDINE